MHLFSVHVGQMIVAAVKALKDKRGSSAQAIGKFIRGTYSDLPLKHGAILKRHLRRLKKRGVLFMVRHSYKLTAAVAGEIPPNGEKRRPGRPRKVVLAGEGEGRKPGRPRTSNGEDAKSDSGAAAPKRKPGRPRKATDAGVTPDSLASAPAPKRKPGRPRKGDPMAAPVLSAPPKSSLGTTNSGEKRKRGRPPKASTEAAQSGENPTLFVPPFASAAATSSKEKRKPGRPPKSPSDAAVKPKPFPLPNAPGGKRKRGRPQKLSSDKIQSRESSSTVDAPVAAKRKPGRPPGSTTKKPNETGRPKKQDIPAPIVEGTSTAASSPKRRGRPPKKTDLEPPTVKVNLSSLS